MVILEYPEHHVTHAYREVAMLAACDHVRMHPYSQAKRKRSSPDVVLITVVLCELQPSWQQYS